jgi:endonuclease III
MKFKNKTFARESKKRKKERMIKVIDILSNEYSEARIQLDYTSPFELLVATILSAQCTDARVNIVTKYLFKKYLSPEDYLSVPKEELEKDIYSTGFYRNKAKSIKGASQRVIDEFGGEVPGNMKDLLIIPGVGRKTANVVLGHCFDIPGIVVDTHVKRLANRLGFVIIENPDKIEFELMELIPEDKWVIFTHYIINHGRKICAGQKPKCFDCAVAEHCPSAVIS